MEVNLTAAGYELVGKNNSKENVTLSKWSSTVNDVYQKAFNWQRVQSTFVDFFPVLETVSKQTGAFINSNKTGNKKFDNIFGTYVKWDLAANATNF